MQIPKRRGQNNHADEENEILLTAEGIKKMERELKRLKREEPEAIEDVSRLAGLGDFSENAEYQEAKGRLRRIQARLFTLNDRLTRAKLIEPSTDHSKVGLGSSVQVETAGKIKTFQLVGPRETNPTKGIISHLSPIGSALMGHRVNDIVEVVTPAGRAVYKIIKIA